MATSPPLRRAVSAVQYVPFLQLETYVAGGGVPDGNYLLVDLSVLIHTPTKRATGEVVGAPRLAVRVTMDPPNGAQTQEERRDQVYGLGGKAHLTYQPDPETAKRIIQIPGAPAANFHEMSNFHIFIKSLYDSGMPKDYAVDDLRALEGIVVHLTSIDEPEERKGFRTQNQTEVQEAPRKPNKIPVVTDVLKAPWLVANGLPAPALAPPPPLVERMVVTPASVGTLPVGVLPVRAPLPVAPVGPPPVAAAAAAEAPVMDSEAAAAQALMEMLDKAPGNTMTKLMAQTEAFRLLKTNPNKQVIMNTYFANNDNLTALLGQIGYALNGGQIAPL